MLIHRWNRTHQRRFCLPLVCYEHACATQNRNSHCSGNSSPRTIHRPWRRGSHLYNARWFFLLYHRLYNGSQRDPLQTKRPQHPLQNFFWHEQHSAILSTIQAPHMLYGNRFSRLYPPLQFTRLLLNRLHGVSIHQTFVHRHRLRQNTIVMNQTFVEHHIPCWGNQLFSRRVVPCRNTIANKPSQSWYNDTVVIQKKTVKMGVDVIHCERVSKFESNHYP